MKIEAEHLRTFSQTFGKGLGGCVFPFGIRPESHQPHLLRFQPALELSRADLHRGGYEQITNTINMINDKYNSYIISL